MHRLLIIIKYLKMYFHCKEISRNHLSNYVQMVAGLLVRIQQLLFTIGRCNHASPGLQSCQFSGL